VSQLELLDDVGRFLSMLLFESREKLNESGIVYAAVPFRGSLKDLPIDLLGQEFINNS
jgi:hypothetical protein